ncbi:uncharacterized protein LOC115891081 [Sitophilus oryzae]|uniref:Uncharacterized protein LOC115891081 n=1 Tax=Sitophilus oryzae TaxID=7048 RepID=A0A6J2YVY0_SITOR|nr:uncharacterized protein LOC115891081 [Sitophilus oryzae]
MLVRSAFSSVLIAGITLFLTINCARAGNIVYTTDDYFIKEKPLQCYDCNSEYDPRCGDPFNPYSIGIVNCTDIKPPEHLMGADPKSRMKPMVCRKIVQHVYHKTRVIRECGYIPDNRDDKSCLRTTGTRDVEVKYCACTQPLCNEGRNIRPVLVTLILNFFITCIILF